MKKSLFSLFICFLIASTSLLNGCTTQSGEESSPTAAPNKTDQPASEATPSPAPADAEEQLIRDMYRAVSEQRFADWSELYAEPVRSYHAYIVGAPEGDHTGIRNVKNAEVLSIEKVDDRYNPGAFIVPELAGEFSDPDKHDCYKVTLNFEVFEKDHDYFTDGESEHCVTLVNMDGEWFVGWDMGFTELDFGGAA